MFKTLDFDPIHFKKLLFTGLMSQPSETIKMVIPAGLYAMQNNLMHVSLTYLDAATFQVKYNLIVM